MDRTLAYAQQLDAQDPLSHWREQFLFPQHEGKPVVYGCGNSLGLQPRTVRAALLAECDHWAEHGVEGHFRGERPWMDYHQLLTQPVARLVGALPHEVVVMNTLTVNLHLMMASFYWPSAQRFKIVMEAGAFPSDQYAVESQVRWHGFDPETAIVEVKPRIGEHTLRTEDIVAAIEQTGEQLALVLFGGVNYYTGQWYELAPITAAGHRTGAQVGFDLAHAVGNVPLQLHRDGPDFAVWCSYKYLNSGPGGPSGVFVHERHAQRPDMPRLAGWWGHDAASRFRMEKGFIPMRGAEGWQLSNAQIFSFAAHLASLRLFDEVGMEALRLKSEQLSAYAYELLMDIPERPFTIITPADPAQRGCQLSLLTNNQGSSIHQRLTEAGVVTDWREPNVIRFAPVPLYNSFEDVWHLCQFFKQ
jgi:kynureninase